MFGDILVGEEFVEFLHVLFGVEGDALALAAVAPGTSRLLVVAFQALGDVVVDDKAHIGLVDAHAEGDGGDNHVHLFHQEFVLILGTQFVVQSGVVGEGLDAVELQQLGKVFHLFARQAVYDAALALVLAHKFHNLFVQLDGFGGLGSHLVVQIGSVE